jgi:FtsH-binding integral membrane protein
MREPLAFIVKNTQNKKIMNKTNIIGLIILIIGIIIPIIFKNDGTDFIAGFLISGGILLVIAGRIKLKKMIKSKSDSQIY